jgi:hypothetical protein
MQRSANETKITLGPYHKDTEKAYNAANQVKREILDMIEQYENSNSK